MGAAEVLLCTHIEIVVVCIVEHSIDAGDGRDADGSRRESSIAIGVVGAVDGEEFVVDALELELLPGELHGGVGLQGHSVGVFSIVQAQAVQVHAGYHGLLGIVGGLLVDDAGERDDLGRGEPHLVGFGLSVAFPEGIALLLHAVEELVEAHIPIEFVGVGHEHADHRGRIVAVALADGGVGEGADDGGAVEHELLRELGTQSVDGAHGGNGEVEGLLLSVLQAAEHGERAVLGLDGIASCPHVIGIAAVADERLHAAESVVVADVRELHEDGVHGVVVVDIEVFGLLALAERRQEEIGENGQHQHEAA